MADSKERRAAERVQVTPESTCSFVAPVGPELGPARLRDVSMDGLGLVLSHPTEIGVLLAVSLSNPSKGFAKTVLVRVTHVTLIHGGYLIGGNLSTPLTYQELTALVM